MALGNAYYMAARISYFDKNIPAKKYLLESFKNRKGWVEEAKVYEIFYIFLLPISRIFNPIIDLIFKKFAFFIKEELLKSKRVIKIKFYWKNMQNLNLEFQR
jgi:hypothetical protein